MRDAKIAAWDGPLHVPGAQGEWLLSGRTDITTGVGFYDHLLTALGHHGLFDLEIRCAGDLAIDEHHTVEDVALARHVRSATAGTPARSSTKPCGRSPW